MSDSTSMWFCRRAYGSVAIAKLVCCETPKFFIVDKYHRATGHRTRVPKGEAFSTYAEAVDAGRAYLSSCVDRARNGLALAEETLHAFCSSVTKEMV